MKLLRLACLSVLVLVCIAPLASAQSNAATCTVLVEPRPNADADGARLFAVTLLDGNVRVLLPTSTIMLDCDSPDEDIRQLEVSPALDFGDPIPVPDNPDRVISDNPGYALVNVSRANVRSSDSVNFKRVAIVNGGTPLIVLGRNAARTWWYVQIDDIRGWISNEVVVLRGDLTDVPIVQTVDAERTEPTVYVGFPGNPIVSEVSADGAEVCRLVGRAEHEVLGRNINGNWYRINGQCNDGTLREGWLQADLGILRNPGRVDIPVLPNR